MTLALLLLVAVALDAIVGDPPYRLHPVRLMGHLANGLETGLRRFSGSGPMALLLSGILLAILHPAILVTTYLGVRYALALAHPVAAYGWDVFVFTSCFAFRDLFRHVTPITTALEHGDLPAARRAVQRIVGRDATALDASGVARASVESIAESLGDGAIGPLFWFMVGGLVGSIGGLGDPASAAIATAAALIYRAVNTLDSMVGHKNEQYLYFGRASARLDDLLNLLPARLAVVALGIAAALLGLGVIRGLTTYRRDRHQHPSPNAGHPESFVAGALGVRLGGPTTYPYGTVDKAWLGDGRVDVAPTDIRHGCRLVAAAGCLAAAATAGTFVICPVWHVWPA